MTGEIADVAVVVGGEVSDRVWDVSAIHFSSVKSAVLQRTIDLRAGVYNALVVVCESC